MKLQQDVRDGRYQFTAYADGKVGINGEMYSGSLLVTPELVESWRPTSFADLQENDFARVLDFVPEVVLLGTGERLRFPHPQLMPGDPVDRARVRLFLLNFEKELFTHVSTLENRALKGNDKALEKARSHIRDRLTQLAPVFLKNKFMLGDNFSMLDVAIAPLLWRLDFYGIELSKNAAPLLKYAERIFSRPAYIEALTPSEKVMRK